MHRLFKRTEKIGWTLLLALVLFFMPAGKAHAQFMGYGGYGYPGMGYGGWGGYGYGWGGYGNPNITYSYGYPGSGLGNFPISGNMVMAGSGYGYGGYGGMGYGGMGYGGMGYGGDGLRRDGLRWVWVRDGRRRVLEPHDGSRPHAAGNAEFHDGNAHARTCRAAFDAVLQHALSRRALSRAVGCGDRRTEPAPTTIPAEAQSGFQAPSSRRTAIIWPTW